MKKILTALIMMLTISGFSQERKISGKVIDDKGLPYGGVTVLIEGTKTATVTDFDGNYSIKATEGNVLVFSYIGMKTQSIKVGESSVIDVIIKDDNSILDEVVVIGYGTQKRSDLTGAVSSIKASEAYNAPVASLDNALQGRAAGVQVTSVSGAPGSSASIRIRGGNSITGGNEPLYVIDGYIGAGDLSTINPNDIQSIEVLKDASSTAIYGARGTNGVVLVTTKKGKKGKISVNFKTSAGMQYLPSQIDVQSGSEYAAWRNAQAAIIPGATLPFDLNNLPGEETNWQDVIISAAPIADYQLAASGNNGTTQYYTSLGYFSQQGIVNNTGFERFSFRTNLDTKLSKVFKTGVNISLSKTNRDNNNLDFTDLLQADPLKPVYNEDGSYTTGNYGLSNKGGNNLLADTELLLNETINSRALVNTFLQAELGNFIIKSTFGGDFIFGRTNEFTPSTYPANLVNGLLATAVIDQNSYVGFLNENTVNYNKNFGKNSINALGGVTFQSNYRETTLQRGKQIPSDGVGVYNMGLAPSDQLSISSGYTESSMFSLLARVNYAYDGKYLATATIRRDGSSMLGENNKFATFPSFALGWKMSEEPFLKNFTKLDILKLRTSYGQTGNSSVGAFSTLPTVSLAGGSSIIDGVLVKGVSQGTLANPDLKWENTAQFDVGLEVSFFKARIAAELDVYYKKTTDLLLDAEVPFFTGFKTTLQNSGSLENRGLDLSITGVIVENKDFRFSTTVNFSTYKNKVLNLGDKSFIATSNLGSPANDTSSRLMVGEPVGVFWGAVYEGIDAETGNAIYADISGPEGVPDGVYNPTYDKTIIGDPNPDFFGGINLDMQYKDFDFAAFFPFSYGNENYNEQMLLATETEVNSFSYLRDNMWSTENKENALVPRAGSASWNVSNSFFVQDASYFRLATLQIGYTIPLGTMKGIERCRFYLTGTNLFLIKNDDYLGFDPDVSSYGKNDVKRGFDNLAYPQNRSILMGIELSL